MQLNQADPQIISEFKRRRTKQIIAVIPFIAAMIPLFLLDEAGPAGLFGISSIVIGSTCIAILIAGLIFSVINWRCPACNSYLGKTISPRFCQKCGAQLMQ